MIVSLRCKSRNYLPNLAHILKPLHKHLRKSSKWNWKKEQKRSFENNKGDTVPSKIASLSKHLSIYCLLMDWVQVLLHTLPDGSEKLTVYPSRTLSSPEENSC